MIYRLTFNKSELNCKCFVGLVENHCDQKYVQFKISIKKKNILTFTKCNNTPT